MARLALLFVLMLGAAGAFAQENTNLDQRVRSLAHDLRCLVCQNQTIADSNAPLALSSVGTGWG